MSRDRNDVLVGAFVLVGIAIVVGGALWLSSARFGVQTRLLTARFETVGQLKPGNDVTLRGVRVGEVETVEFAPEGDVRVTLRVDMSAPVPERAVVLLRPATLFGQWEAAIVAASARPGGLTAADSALWEQGVLPGVTQADFSDLSRYTAEIAQNLQSITTQLEAVFTEETTENLARVIRNFEQASTDLASLVSRQRESFTVLSDDMAAAGGAARRAAVELDSAISRLESATEEGELSAIFDHAAETSRNLSRLSADLQQSTRKLDRVLARGDTALTSAERFFTRLNRGEGALGRLTTDTALYESTLLTLAELRALLEDLRSSPGKYFNFSIF